MRIFYLILIESFIVLFLNHPDSLAEQSVYSEIPSEKIFKNHTQIVKALQYGRFYNQPKKRRIRIGILDNGFSGYMDPNGRRVDKYLPQDTEYFDLNEDNSNSSSEESTHGYGLATLISEMMTDGRNIPDLAPKLFLFKTSGYTGLKNATEKASTLNLDLILYAQVFEYGGNFDGKGFYNQIISDFLGKSKNTIWINAAGNFRNTVFNSPIMKSDNRNGFIKLPDPEDTLIIKCDPLGYLPSTSNSCSVKIVLSWNDFKNKPDAGTKKNLDLLLLDDLGGTISSSSLEQVLSKSSDVKKAETLNPREMIQTTLKRGTYFLRVRDSSNNFDPGKDKFRISIYGPGMSMVSHDRQENLLNPADHPKVLTVGANDDEESSVGVSSVSISMKKPNINIFSTVDLPDNFKTLATRDTTMNGSSAASALIAAKAGLILSQTSKPKLTLTEIINVLKNDSSATSPKIEGDPQQPTTPLSKMMFSPQKNGQKGCFEAANLAEFRKSYPSLGEFIAEQNPNSGKPFFAYMGDQKFIVLFFLNDPIDQVPEWRTARIDSTTGEDRPLYIPSYDPTLDPQLNLKWPSQQSPFKLLTRTTIYKKNKNRGSRDLVIPFEQFPKDQKECRNAY